jgi:hypothetical protein
MPGNHRPKTLDIWAIKNPKRYQRASWVGDGLNTVFDFEVLISLGPKITETLETRKPPFFGHSFLGNFRAFLTTFGHLRRLFIRAFPGK